MSLLKQLEAAQHDDDEHNLVENWNVSKGNLEELFMKLTHGTGLVKNNNNNNNNNNLDEDRDVDFNDNINNSSNNNNNNDFNSNSNAFDTRHDRENQKTIDRLARQLDEERAKRVQLEKEVERLTKLIREQEFESVDSI